MTEAKFGAGMQASCLLRQPRRHRDYNYQSSYKSLATNLFYPSNRAQGVLSVSPSYHMSETKFGFFIIPFGSGCNACPDGFQMGNPSGLVETTLSFVVELAGIPVQPNGVNDG